MKFLCDVHISYKVVRYRKSSGFEATHVNDILNKWHTTDHDICAYADQYDRIVLSKDSDFKNSFLISGTPRKLVKVNLGNLSTSVLIKVIDQQLLAIQQLHANGTFMVELDHKFTTFTKR